MKAPRKSRPFFFTLHGRRDLLSIVSSYYSVGGLPAVEMFESETGLPFARLSTNPPRESQQETLSEGEFYLKNWSENAQLTSALVEQGKLEVDPKRGAQCGHCWAPIAKLKAIHWEDEQWYVSRVPLEDTPIFTDDLRRLSCEVGRFVLEYNFPWVELDKYKELPDLLSVLDGQQLIQALWDRYKLTNQEFTPTESEFIIQCMKKNTEDAFHAITRPFGVQDQKPEG